MNKKITVNLAVAIAIIAMTVTFVVTMILSMQLFNRTVSGVREKEIMYNKLSEMDKSARENYYGEIVDDTLYDYIAAGYVTGMGDKDARYYTAKQYLEYLNQQNGVVMGLSLIHIFTTEARVWPLQSIFWGPCCMRLQRAAPRRT